MAKHMSLKDAPDEHEGKPPRLCAHVWVTAAPFQARCAACGLVVPITTKEV